MFFKMFLTFIISVMIGMMIYFILPKKIENHGPDSSIVRKKTYYDDKGNMIKFVPVPIIPPIHFF